MIIFCVNEEELPMNETSTILDLKQEIIKKYKLSTKYIDLVFLMDKPSRILGKFNVEPGKVARPFDRHRLDKFAFKDKIRVEYSQVEGYEPKKKVVMKGLGRGRGRGLGGGSGSAIYNLTTRPTSIFDHTTTEQSLTLEPQYNLDSIDDFPTL
jgi:hypothetical protein